MINTLLVTFNGHLCSAAEHHCILNALFTFKDRRLRIFVTVFLTDEAREYSLAALHATQDNNRKSDEREKHFTPTDQTAGHRQEVRC